MASNSRPRSSSSASRSRPTARPTAVKGRPSQGKSPRRSQARPRTGGYRSTQVSQPHAAAQRARQAEQLRSVSISQVRNASRYRARKANRRFTAVALTSLVVVAVLIVGAVVLLNAQVFKIERVTVSGAAHLTDAELTELALVPEGATLLNVDVSGISSRLQTNPWVKAVDVQRVFPDTLNLAVTERSITAVVSVTVDATSQTTERWALASDGMWLTKIPDQESEEGQALPSSVYEDAAAALEITDIPYGSLPEAGQICDNANVENALGIIDGMSTELADQVKSVSAASSDSTTLTLDNGIEIAFGDSSDIRDKERVCLRLMEEYPDQISYINVRVVNKPVWRSL